MTDFKKLLVWEKAHKLVLAVYQVTSKFPSHEQYGITSQLRRASTSIPTNIAEGSAKSTQKDFAKFLQIALGSCQESEYLLILSQDLKYLSNEDFETLNGKANEVKAMLIAFIKKVRTK
jgi:four helix bundle protein